MKPETREIYSELKKIENEIQMLRILLMKFREMPRKTAKLEGTLKRVKIEEEDIKEAKESIFKLRA